MTDVHLAKKGDIYNVTTLISVVTYMRIRMRLWMVNPTIMCRQHLLGEHNETHMFAGTLRKKVSIDGYLIEGELDPRLLYPRHEELVAEMLRRGYGHYSPLEVPDFSYLSLREEYYINSNESLDLLLSRCANCRERYRT